MSAQHFILWVDEDEDRVRIASRNAYRLGEASYRNDDARVVPHDLVEALGFWSWQTPVNGPFPAFAAERLEAIVTWLADQGYTARVLPEPPA